MNAFAHSYHRQALQAVESCGARVGTLPSLVQGYVSSGFCCHANARVLGIFSGADRLMGAVGGYRVSPVPQSGAKSLVLELLQSGLAITLELLE